MPKAGSSPSRPTGLVVPSNAVDTDGGAAWVLRVDGRQDREGARSPIGLRDPQTERVQLAGGVEAGDVLLRGAGPGHHAGHAGQLRRARAPR